MSKIQSKTVKQYIYIQKETYFNSTLTVLNYSLQLHIHHNPCYIQTQFCGVTLRSFTYFYLIAVTLFLYLDLSRFCGPFMKHFYFDIVH